MPYDWVQDDPIVVGVTSSTGIETVSEVPAAVETPSASARGFIGYGVIGFFVGVVPVALGLLWLPSLRRADPKWLAAFMALTAGLLSFLAASALRGDQLRRRSPEPSADPGLVLLGVALSAWRSRSLGRRRAAGRARRESPSTLRRDRDRPAQPR